MIEASRRQLSFAEGLIAEEVEELWEDWMRSVDGLLADPQLLEVVYQALARRRPNSRTRGRPGTPADVVLRMLLLKHIRQWSYADLEREVRANLVYRQFTRVGAGKVPDAKTLGKIGITLGPAIIEQLHQRVVAIAVEKKLVHGRRLRVDTIVVQTDIHYPTDSSLLGDGVRVLTRAMRKIADLSDFAGAQLPDRTRSAGQCARWIAQVSRSKAQQGQERLKAFYEKLLAITGRVVGQAKRFAREVAAGVKSSARMVEQACLESQRRYLETLIPRVRQVMHQARARVLGSDTHVAGKIVSLFESHTEVIGKGKASKPTEFGKMVKVQEAEGQIVTHYQVYDQRPNDADLRIPALDLHQQQFGRAPRVVAADAAFFSLANEKRAHDQGVKRVAIPNRRTKSTERRKLEKKRWFKGAQKWRTGVEGRISVLKRRHGLNRCRYKGSAGIQRWVGLGVISDNLINIGRTLAEPVKT